MNTKALGGIILALIILGGVAYYLSAHKPAGSAGNTHTVAWRIEPLENDISGAPHRDVIAVVDGKEYDSGSQLGTCSEIGMQGGVDGKGLLEGELAGVQCWWAGGGSEIGVFQENGTILIKVGGLDEGNAETPGFRGDFKTIFTL